MILIFGIANFKNNYGLRKKKISLNNIKDIFSSLEKEKLIKFIDTAPSYYQDNKDYLNKIKNFKVFSKLKKIPSNLKNNLLKLEKFVTDELILDLKKLKVKNFEGYYVHDINDALKHGRKLYLIFKKLKNKGLIKKIGLSFYDIESEIKVLKYFKPDIAQLPFNLLYNNKKYKNYLKQLRKKNITIFARSIYLQGIILKQWKEIPSQFRDIKSKVKFLETNYGYDTETKKIQLTIHEIKKNKLFDGIIFSVDSKKDLNQFVKIYKKKNNANLETPLLGVIRKKELDPRRW